MNKISIKLSYVLSSVIILSLTLGACGGGDSTPDDSGDVSDVRVEKAEAIRTIVGTEEFPLNNCGGTRDLSQSLGTETTVEKGVTIGARATNTLGGEVEIPEVVRLRLEAQVERSYQQNYETASSHLVTIHMEAAPGTHVVYVIQWEEQKFASTVSYAIGGQVYKAPYTYVLRIPKITDSYQPSCPSPPSTPTVTSGPPPPTDTPTPTPAPGYVSIRLPETYLRHDRHSMAAEGFSNPLRGSQTLGGIDFEFVGAGSFIQTQFQYEDEPYSGIMPQEVPIRVDVGGARKVYVLMNLAYGCAKWAPRDSLVGEIEFVFDDGTSEKTPLRTGYNIREWSIGATQLCGGPIIDRLESTATVQQVWQGYRQNSSVLTVIDMHVFELPPERSGQRLMEIVIRDTSLHAGGHMNPAIIVFAITVLV